MAHTIEELRTRQNYPLDLKIALTMNRIREWVNRYGEDGVYISFSGGKDSTVLMDIVRNKMGYKDIPAMFVNVPTQFPELKTFAMTWDNVEIVNPKISFMQVCEKYGFPIISKETSECVQGARKYLTSVRAELESLQTDRQTDRQTDLPYAQFYRKVAGIGEYQKKETIPNEVDLMALAQGSRGGYDRKYRRLRGIGEFNAQGQVQEKRVGSEISQPFRNEHERQQLPSEGEYP